MSEILAIASYGKEVGGLTRQRFEIFSICEHLAKCEKKNKNYAVFRLKSYISALVGIKTNKVCNIGTKALKIIFIVL
jgi:hypothetical protein